MNLRYTDLETGRKMRLFLVRALFLIPSIIIVEVTAADGTEKTPLVHVVLYAACSSRLQTATNVGPLPTGKYKVNDCLFRKH
jgi:hypothetical protein